MDSAHDDALGAVRVKGAELEQEEAASPAASVYATPRTQSTVGKRWLSGGAATGERSRQRPAAARGGLLSPLPLLRLFRQPQPAPTPAGCDSPRGLSPAGPTEEWEGGAGARSTPAQVGHLPSGEPLEGAEQPVAAATASLRQQRGVPQGRPADTGDGAEGSGGEVTFIVA